MSDGSQKRRHGSAEQDTFVLALSQAGYKDADRG
jgi:hypothetical protein